MRSGPSRPRRARAAAWALALVAAAWALVPAAPPTLAQAAYSLYYSFQVPLVLPGVTLSDSGSLGTLAAKQFNYSGTLRGSLGGLAVTSAAFSYGTGASLVAGGGTFTLVTDAGSVTAGGILMTVDPANHQHTTLVFLGTYLGTRIEFSLTGDQPQIGGSGYVATGLANTGFASHADYIAAVRRATESLAPAARTKILDDANTNARLVAEYQQRHPAPETR